MFHWNFPAHRPPPSHPIPSHQLWLECACDHNGPVNVSAIIANWGDQITDFRIIFVGGAWGALRGAKQGPR